MKISIRIKHIFSLVLIVSLTSIVNAQDRPPALEASESNGLIAGGADVPPVTDFAVQNAENSAAVCIIRSTEIANSYINDQKDIKGSVHAFFYDSSGRPCFIRKSTRITEGDLIVVGYFGKKTDPLKFKSSQTTCEVESPDGRIRDQFINITSNEKLQSGRVETALLPSEIGFRELDKFDCYGAEAKFKLIRVSDDIDLDEKAIKQYARYNATWQVGALWTDLQDRDYKLVDRGAGNVISSDADNSKGPIYVGNVTIYGFPRHVQSWFGDKRYSGRDIINHNDFYDRIGLSLSFGLEDPTDTLGIGLSYEIVTGLSLTYTQLYRRIEVLDGVSEGDTFSSSDIPTKETWEDDAVWGITIDGRLISKFFGGSK